jgi:hypothetical protein
MDNLVPFFSCYTPHIPTLSTCSFTFMFPVLHHHHPTPHLTMYPYRSHLADPRLTQKATKRIWNTRHTRTNLSHSLVFILKTTLIFFIRFLSLPPTTLPILSPSRPHSLASSAVLTLSTPPALAKHCTNLIGFFVESKMQLASSRRVLHAPVLQETRVISSGAARGATCRV